MPESEIKVIKSPIVPVDIPDEDRVIYSNEFTYYVRLSSGIIATKPEDFPDDEYEIEVEEVIED